MTHLIIKTYSEFRCRRNNSWFYAGYLSVKLDQLVLVTSVCESWEEMACSLTCQVSFRENLAIFAAKEGRKTR